MRHALFLSSVPLLAALALFDAGCRKDSPNALRPASPGADPSPDYVVATVDGTPLIWADMEKRAMGFLKDDVESNHLVIPPARMEEAKEHFRRRAINTYVFKTLMMQEASRQQVRLTPSDRQDGLASLANALKARNWTTNDFFLKGPLGQADMRREFEDGLVIDKLLKLKVLTACKVDEKEVAGAIAQLDATNELKRVKLESVRKQLLEGADFEGVARTVSECPSAKNGGDLGEFGRGKMDKAFETAAFAQPIGSVGPVVETRFGYHIIKVTAHTPAKAATASTPAVPETVRASHILLKRIPVDRKKLQDTLLRAKFNAGRQELFNTLKAKSKIECFLYKDMTF